MLAHIKENGEQQTLAQHSLGVSKLCERFVARRLQSVAGLIGLLHDMGKGTEGFQEYLAWAAEHPMERQSHPNHSGAGGLYAYKHWYRYGSGTEKMTAQMIALCICGHHAGFHDCISEDGSSGLLRFLEQEDNALYSEAERYFLSEIACKQELDRLFHLACDEVAHLPAELKKSTFYMGMLTRLLLSILVDADRWNTACFEYGYDPFETTSEPDWAKLTQTFDTFCDKHFTGTDRLSGIRSAISDACAEKALSSHGIFRLTVPTGGGKTLSSLRYALLHAQLNHQRRIFYIIPFNTILDQNARDIRNALGDYHSVLEHHSNVVLERESDATDFYQEEQDYKRLTERWDSDIILTSMVQFMNALYSGKNTDARRLHRLTNAVLIFDEIQALPKHCKSLFELGIQFLSHFFHCTIVLCTATQPQLAVEAKELMPNVDQLYQNLQRVHFFPEITPLKTCEEASRALSRLVREKRAVLMITNTKAAAWNIFDFARQILEDSGYCRTQTPPGLTDEQIQEMACSAGDNEILCVHLSTLMCPAHRLEMLRWVRIWSAAKKRILCVSTALIEAGINVSFPVVVRSLTGLPSIIQAAGRCNRNMEAERGEVYIWQMTPDDEKLPASLQEIRDGQQISGELMERYAESPDRLGEREAIASYFKEAYKKNKRHFNYPWKGTTLKEVLSGNTDWKEAALLHNTAPWGKMLLHQGFRSAGKEFQVIDQQTRSVIVPYGKGKALMEEMQRALPMKEKIRLLRQIQTYSVNLFEGVYQRLVKENGLRKLDDMEIMVLNEQYYSMDGGVQTKPQEMEFMLL